MYSLYSTENNIPAPEWLSWFFHMWSHLVLHLFSLIKFYIHFYCRIPRSGSDSPYLGIQLLHFFFFFFFFSSFFFSSVFIKITNISASTFLIWLKQSLLNSGRNTLLLGSTAESFWLFDSFESKWLNCPYLWFQWTDLAQTKLGRLVKVNSITWVYSWLISTHLSQNDSFANIFGSSEPIWIKQSLLDSEGHTQLFEITPDSIWLFDSLTQIESKWLFCKYLCFLWADLNIIK